MFEQFKTGFAIVGMLFTGFMVTVFVLGWACYLIEKINRK